MITLDTIPKLIIAGLTIVASVALIVFPVVSLFRWFFSRGGRASLKGASAGIGDDGTAQVLAKLEEMNKERTAARARAAEAEQTTQSMFKKVLVSIDGILEALQAAKIGNGNLERARLSLRECGDERDQYLIDQLSKEKAT
jgi:hypothetical protein